MPTQKNKANAIFTVIFLMIVVLPAFNNAEKVVVDSSNQSYQAKIDFYDLNIKSEASTPAIPVKTQISVKTIVTLENKQEMIQKTQMYINKYFSNTPVTAELLVNLSQANNFPLDFLLVSGHLESHMCTKGRAVPSKNCHNVDNTDAGDNRPTVCGQYTNCLDSIVTGEQKFINLIKNCYFQADVVPSLRGFIDQDFRVQRTVRPFCSARVGSRYMTDVRAKYKYENAIINYVNHIFK